MGNRAVIAFTERRFFSGNEEIDEAKTDTIRIACVELARTADLNNIQLVA